MQPVGAHGQGNCDACALCSAGPGCRSERGRSFLGAGGAIDNDEHSEYRLRRYGESLRDGYFQSPWRDRLDATLLQRVDVWSRALGAPGHVPVGSAEQVVNSLPPSRSAAPDAPFLPVSNRWGRD